jgi:ankyrin repeat protein
VGVNFGVVDYRGRNCLHIAAISKNFEIAEYVLDQKNNIDIDFDKIDLAGCSPLYYAISYNNNDIALLLV